MQNHEPSGTNETREGARRAHDIPRCPCSSTGADEPSFVYAAGRIQARIPTLGLEKELAQLTGRSHTAGLTDRETLSTLLAKRENRYLARRVCWVLSIEGIETYIVRPEDDATLDQLVLALRAAPRPTDVDVIVGRREELASPAMCNGLVLPIVRAAQVYSFDVDDLVSALPGYARDDGGKGRRSAEEVFYRLVQIAENAGATDEHRALNYLTVRYPAIYALAADKFDQAFALRAVDVRPSRLSTSRKVVDVIFSFAHRQTDMAERFVCRVDVTEEFPFLAKALSPFFDVA